MIYSQSIIEEVRTGNDIVDIINRYTALKQKGNSHVGLCPFHNEKTPSFSVSSEKQLYHCFGCGASGNVISFIMQKENYDFIDTIKYLADKINYSLPDESFAPEAKRSNALRNELFDIHKKAARYYYDALNSKMGLAAKEYLDKRKIDLAIRNKFGLGYSPFRRNDLYEFLIKEGFSHEAVSESGLVIKDKNGGYFDRFFNRVMFPIIDVQGRIIGFGGRALETKNASDENKHIAKYLNSPDTPIFNKSNNLYGINFARLSGTKEFILVEGYMDVISLHQAGFHNAVAALGTAFNDNHARALKKYANKVIILFDSDEAGVKAVLRAIPVLINSGVVPKVLQVADAKDPDEYIGKFGAEAFGELLGRAQSYISFQIEQKRKNYNLEESSQVIDFTKEVAALLATLDNAIERDVFIKEAAQLTKISYEAISTEVKKLSDTSVVNMNAQRYNTNAYKLNKNGVDDAKKSIINIIANNSFVYTKVKSILTPKELIEPIYSIILETIYNLYENKQPIQPAELVSFFEDINEQKIVSEIFMVSFSFDTTEELQIAVNDHIKLIKKNYIDANVSSISDISAFQELMNMKKSIDLLDIKF